MGVKQWLQWVWDSEPKKSKDSNRVEPSTTTVYVDEKPVPVPEAPKLVVTVSMESDGLVKIESDFNTLAIGLIDQVYLKRDSTWKVGRTDNEKVVICLADILGAMADQYDPLPSAADQIMGNIDHLPTIGEAPIRQVVDLDKREGGRVPYADDLRDKHAQGRVGVIT